MVDFTINWETHEYLFEKDVAAPRLRRKICALTQGSQTRLGLNYDRCFAAWGVFASAWTFWAKPAMTKAAALVAGVLVHPVSTAEQVEKWQHRTAINRRHSPPSP